MAKDEKKSETINIRLTPTEKRLLEKTNLSPTEVFNRALHERVLEERRETARKNLGEYPTIKRLFSEAWIQEEIERLKFDEEEGIIGSDFAWLPSAYPEKEILEQMQKNIAKARKGDVDAGMLAHLQGRWAYEPMLKLRELEQNLRTLEKEPKIKRTIMKAKNEGQFWPTFSEIEVAAAFKRQGLLKELEPSINGKTPDLLVNLDSKDFCVEVFTPQLSQKLTESMKNHRAVSLGNRARDQIGKKLSQLPPNVPSIIAINTGFSEIDPDLVADAILGTLSLIVPRDRTMEAKTVRQPDGLAYSYNLTTLKAIVVYRRFFNFECGLLSKVEIKPLEIEGEDNLIKKQEKILKDIFNSIHSPM